MSSPCQGIEQRFLAAEYCLDLVPFLYHCIGIFGQEPEFVKIEFVFLYLDKF